MKIVKIFRLLLYVILIRKEKDIRDVFWQIYKQENTKVIDNLRGNKKEERV